MNSITRNGNLALDYTEVSLRKLLLMGESQQRPGLPVGKRVANIGSLPTRSGRITLIACCVLRYACRPLKTTPMPPLGPDAARERDRPSSVGSPTSGRRSDIPIVRTACCVVWEAALTGGGAFLHRENHRHYRITTFTRRFGTTITFTTCFPIIQRTNLSSAKAAVRSSSSEISAK
jgi:hypothetical protein